MPIMVYLLFVAKTLTGNCVNHIIQLESVLID